MNLKQSNFSKVNQTLYQILMNIKKSSLIILRKPSDNLELKKDLIQSKYKNYYLDKINNKPELKIDA